MTDYCANANGFGRVETGFRPAEVSYKEIVARGTYGVVRWIADLHGQWRRHRQAVMALDYLRTLDDRSLADIGLSRSELTIAGLNMAAERCETTRSRP